MRGLHDAGAIDKQTLRDFEAQALQPAPYLPLPAAALRMRADFGFLGFLGFLINSPAASVSGTR